MNRLMLPSHEEPQVSGFPLISKSAHGRYRQDGLNKSSPQRKLGAPLIVRQQL